MSTTGHAPTEAADAGALAAALREASFVHLVVRADADGVAAGGLLASALAGRGTPYQLSVARTTADAARRVDGNDDSTTCAVIGLAAQTADVAVEGAEPTSAVAFDAARDLGADPDPGLALAGVHVRHATPPGELLDAAEAAGIDRRPGVAVPTADLGDGLAHSTLLHAPFSGDAERGGALLAELDLPADLDDGAHTRVASAVAVDAVTGAPERASEAIERALRPLVPGQFETVGGDADVVDVLARVEPGLAVAMALDQPVREDALDAWRDASEAVHAAVRTADVGDSDAEESALAVARVEDADPSTTARLLRDYRTDAPAVLVVRDGSDDPEDAGDGTEAVAALATADPTALESMRDAASACDGSAGGMPRLACATFATDAETFVERLEAER